MEERWERILAQRGLGMNAGKGRALRDATGGLDANDPRFAKLMETRQSAEGALEIEALAGLHGEVPEELKEKYKVYRQTE